MLPYLYSLFAPPRIRCWSRPRTKSLDELEDLIGTFSREYADDNIQDDGSDVGSGEFGAEQCVKELLILLILLMNIHEYS